MNLETIEKSIFIKLFKKYVILLFVFALANIFITMLLPILIGHFMDAVKMEEGYSILESFWYQNYTYFLRIGFNILFAVFIWSDFKNINYKLWAIVGVTLLDREIGVLLFLLLVLYEKKFSSQS